MQHSRKIALLISALSMVVASGSAFSADLHVTSQSQVEDLKRGLGVGGNGAAVPMPPAALAMVKYFEDWVPNAYDDPSGYCTIGYGHLIALKSCTEKGVLGKFAKDLSLSEGEQLLEEDTLSSRLAVQKLVTVNLTKAQFGALSSFVFNVGKENFAKSTLLKLLNGGDNKLAADQFNRWVKSKGVVLNGLVARRSCERAMFDGASLLDDHGKFRVNRCASLGIGGNGGAPIDIEVGETGG